MSSLRYLNKYLYRYKHLLILGILFTIISNFFLILPAQVVRYAFNAVEETIDWYFLFQGFESQQAVEKIFTFNILIYGIIILVMALLRGFFLFLVRQTLIVMSRFIEYDLKDEIYRHYQTLPLNFYRQNQTGDLMARISEDVSQVRMYLGPGIMYGINLIAVFAMVIPYMFAVDYKLTLYTLIPLPILSVSIYFVNNLINSRSEQIQKSLSSLSSFVQEAFSGIRVLKAFAREKDSEKQFAQETERYRKQSLRLVKVEALFYPLVLALIGLSNILVVYVGGLEVVAGRLTKGNIAEFVLYLNMMIWPVTSLGWIASIIQKAAVSQRRINEFLAVKTDIVSTQNLRKPIQGHIVFENVSLTYANTGIEALKNISFEIKPNESLAILGSTGSGKTTIANLICRMYDATKGQIFIDATPIKDYEVSYLRSQIGYVPQDVFLFSDTIRNNIAFGLPNATAEQVEQAAQWADVYENIMQFPQKFQTIVGERGITLSGGQKQRVSIARALIKNPTILLLDDCLSAVDTKTENAILRQLQDIMQNRTTIIISHRVSSAKLANKIIVLDKGEIVEQGTHEELLALGGIYKELYEKQLQTEEV
ncbi:ABC transporter ATP-binding protein [Raineya orbicola]|jgi:ATP-binding cassette subfamily B protein|uniref:ABC-type multidrug transport system ATPase and permease component n=1 Tax=Raineya orbicola TaxID=2016530 RepID=A0A2N3IA88_9BACT|nr:ABC transporter ATP-binding protein [Raineya orbicola]PKQ67252.1 ABC-type multidrug transport system ATPase and permease component [Raineya orbicola]